MCPVITKTSATIEKLKSIGETRKRKGHVWRIWNRWISETSQASMMASKFASVIDGTCEIYALKSILIFHGN